MAHSFSRACDCGAIAPRFEPRPLFPLRSTKAGNLCQLRTDRKKIEACDITLASENVKNKHVGLLS